MAYQDNGEIIAELQKSGRIDRRYLENWIEKTERILARMDEPQRTWEMPANGDCIENKLVSPSITQSDASK